MNATVAETIRNRRTTHQFVRDSAPPDPLILDAIAHALWAPNHYLSQPWRFYLLGPGTSEAICKLNAELVRQEKGDKAAEMKLQRWREMPGWLLLNCVQDADAARRQEDYAACCCAAQNLMLFLWDQGVGVKWTTGEMLQSDRFAEIVGFNAQLEQPVGIFWYGRPAEVREVARKSIDEVLFRRP